MKSIKARSWDELCHFNTPQWFKDAKFGIYTHWGVYAAGACGPNVSWYPYYMYREGTKQYKHHCRGKFGHPSKAGYKDLIPKFDAAKFDAGEWAEIFAASGAQFAGPVAEHHDSFSMWDSGLTKWNAKLLGPKRDISGELEKAYRKAGMKFMASFHHGMNWRFYPHWMKGWDVSDPAYEGLYGEIHNTEWDSKTAHEPGFMYDQDLPSIKAQELWLNKIVEFIDKYGPDYIWLENDLEFIGDYYKHAALTYYFDYAAAHAKEVVVSYKNRNLPMSAGLYNIERGHFQDLTCFDWICDTTIDSHEAWGYMENAAYKTGRRLIHYLVDNVSKNGCLLLNAGPKPNGEIPKEAKIVLKEIGDWLKVNGEAVYGTRPWVLPGVGPTVMEVYGEGLDTHDVPYTPQDIRFTVKDDILYAICLGEISDQVVIPEIGDQFYRTYLGEIESVNLLGDGRGLLWKKEKPNMVINTVGVKVQKNANVFKIQRKKKNYRQKRCYE